MFEGAEKGIEWFMKNWDIKGASVAVAREGRLLYARDLAMLPFQIPFRLNLTTGSAWQASQSW
jgi:hypothetical protein